jgi:O-glycosyl hydrolase
MKQPMKTTRCQHAALVASAITFLCAAGPAVGEPAETVLRVFPQRTLQEFHGMGCGVIYYEAHITSLAANGRGAEQTALYDAMFREVRTDFLQLMIRHDHEPANDNADPLKPGFDLKHFAYADHTIAICRAARERNPRIRFYATLYTPPPWMKTNGAESAGGDQRATIRPGTEWELAEHAWAFLARMAQAGLPVEFLSIANEPDWPHTQPGYCLTPDTHAALVAKVARFLDSMARSHPGTPRAKIVGPNTLSAVDAAARWLPPADRAAPGAIQVVGSHDYDRRGLRIEALKRAAGDRPVWITEWCVNGKDPSPDLLHSAGEYWLAMTEAFNQGANAWMAYDWAYPPRDGGEALIHINWGRSFHKTRIYHGFRQWCAVLEPGMRVADIELTGQHAGGISKPGVKAAAFLSADGKRLVVHAANVQDAEALLRIEPGGGFAQAGLRRWRTSATEDCAVLEDGDPKAQRLPPRSLNTWEWRR